MEASRKVLVVDDEPIVNESCRRILGARGFDVATTESGRDGLCRAATQHFDLVVTDLKMPDLDGMELVRAIRKERPDTAIVIITGFGTVPSAVEAVRLGVADYIEKPFTPTQLADAVAKALGPPEPEHVAERIEVEADLVKQVLRRASGDRSFADDLMTRPSRVLCGVALGPEAKAAIASGDVAWIEKHCGELTDGERTWLEQRLEAEIW
ncbi:MAG TPA: response regulator [Planctomycetota bacterium]|nr:response regulator [Planctomycetota bacterium]